MDRRLLVPIGVACLVLLSGCFGFGPSEGGDGTTPGETTTTTAATTTAAETTTTTTTEETTTTTEETTTEETTTAATTDPWSAPSPPNTPFQNRLDREAGNRIESVAVQGDGSSEFTLEITANTSMASVDPAEHGSVRGEPFFLVYANATISNTSSGVKVNGTLVERSELLAQEENGTFTITVREGGLEEAGIEAGETQLLVLLMDRDKKWDDVYGLRKITVEYAPSEEE